MIRDADIIDSSAATLASCKDTAAQDGVVPTFVSIADVYHEWVVDRLVRVEHRLCEFKATDVLG